jgi:hypothetical protein
MLVLIFQPQQLPLIFPADTWEKGKIDDKADKKRLT